MQEGSVLLKMDHGAQSLTALAEVGKLLRAKKRIEDKKGLSVASPQPSAERCKGTIN